MALLNPQQIAKLGTDALAALPSLKAAVQGAKLSLADHNHTKGAPRVEPGPVDVAWSALITIEEQLKKHVEMNTPKPAPEAAPATAE